MITLGDNQTWVKIYRDMQKWEWYTDGNTMRLFLHLILKANIKDGRFKGIEVKRGQLVTSYDHLSRELKLSVKQIRTALNHLKWTGEVASQAYHDFTLITVLNFDKYQTTGASQGATKGQAEGKPRASQGQQSKNIRIKEEKKENIKEKRVAVEPEQEPLRDWEIEMKVPERFIGRFRDKKAWLDFMGVDEDGIPINFGRY